MPFLNKTLLVRTGNGLDDELLEPLVFEREDKSVVRAPTGATTDGLSVPRCLQNVIPATGGDWFSGVLHDAAYRNQLEIQVQGYGGFAWSKAGFTQSQSDDLILEALKSQGVSLPMRQIIFHALRMFGGFAFRDDRKSGG